MTIALIDIGGTSIKFGLWQQGKVREHASATTPDSLDEFYNVLKRQVSIYQRETPIDGVAISSPGSVDQAAGVIRGASAIPYIHNFKIVNQLKNLFGTQVSIENDANCAGLAESTYGAAKDYADSVFIIIGSGIGGAVILDGKVRHGPHLLGGEFGYMLDNSDKTISMEGSPVWMAKRYNANEHPHNPLDGKEIFALASAGDRVAQRYLHDMYFALAKTIFNLQYSLDPEVFVLGGGVSNDNQLLPGVQAAVSEVMEQVKIGQVKPQVKLCAFRSDANLIGAAVNYQQTFKEND